jgi:hypothetical protein
MEDDGADISGLIPANTAPATAIEFRMRGEGGAPAGAIEYVELPRRAPTPATTVGRFVGNFVNANDDEVGYAVTINIADNLRDVLAWSVVGTAYGDDVDGDVYIDLSGLDLSNALYRLNLYFPAYTVIGTETFAASLPREVTIPARAAAPNAVFNVTNGTITGVSTAMERLVGTDWERLTASSLTREQVGIANNATGDVTVRTAATATARASQTRVVTVPALAGVTTASIDFALERLINVNDTMEFRRTGTTAWTPVAPGQTYVSITSLIFAHNAAATVVETLEVRTRATAGNAAGAVQTLAFPRRAAAPLAANNRLVPVDEVILSGTATQWQRAGALVWTNITAGNTIVADDDAAMTFNLRYAPTAGAFASTALAVTVPARGTAPNPVYNATNDTVTGVSAAMVFSFDRDADPDDWVAVPGTNLTRGEAANQVPVAGATIYVRTPATATARASRIGSVVVPAGRAAPENLSICFETYRLQGVNATMEFRRAGTTAWTRVTPAMLDGNTWVSIANIIPASNAAANIQALEVRLASVPAVTPNPNADPPVLAVAGQPASVTSTLNMPRRPATPVAANHRLVVQTERIPAVPANVGDVLEYSTDGGTTWTTVTGTYIDASRDAAATYWIRVAGARTGTDQTGPASLHIAVTVAARVATPDAERNVDTGVITGVRTTMEFRVRFPAGTPNTATDEDGFGWTSWTRVSGSTIPVVATQGGSVVEIRVMGTTSVRPSRVQTISLTGVGGPTLPTSCYCDDDEGCTYVGCLN